MQVDLNTLLNEAAGNTATPGDPAPEEPKTGDPAPEDPKPEDPKPEDPKPGDPKPEDPKPGDPAPEDPKPNKPNPMKEVRDRLNAEQKEREKLSNAIERLSDGDYNFKLKDFKNDKGKVDIDALIKAMDDADNKTKAEAKGITPEVQAEIDRIEREKVELQKERLKVSMDRAISDLQITRNLDRNAVNQFFADALNIKKNPYQWLNQGGSLDDLYYLVYKDRIIKESVDKAVADAKATWESQNTKVPPTGNPAAPKPATNTEGLSIQDLKNLASK